MVFPRHEYREKIMLFWFFVFMLSFILFCISLMMRAHDLPAWTKWLVALAGVWLSVGMARGQHQELSSLPYAVYFPYKNEWVRYRYQWFGWQPAERFRTNDFSGIGVRRVAGEVYVPRVGMMPTDNLCELYLAGANGHEDLILNRVLMYHEQYPDKLPHEIETARLILAEVSSLPLLPPKAAQAA